MRLVVDSNIFVSSLDPINRFHWTLICNLEFGTVIIVIS
jgi:hypothetical protein